MRIKKRIFALVMMVVMVFASVSVNAQNTEQQGNDFNDVGSDHWAYEYIQLMTDKGIINGYDDGTFKPSATVSRAEFAKMMVLTLNIEPYSPATATFEDVEKSNWAYKYVETGKYYLTGFKSTSGYTFRPGSTAVREDMAVAVVKGLGINADETDMSILDSYSDEDSISPNLRKYVAAAINEGIMIGSGGSFSPQGNLNRAEAATLLARLIVEEKVTFDEEEKVTFEEAEAEAQKTPTLETVLKDDEVVLEWTEVPSDGFKYYKVVISATDSSPSYPHRGHAVPLGHGTNRYVLESGHSHSGLTLKGGEKYYVAITAVYEGEVYNTSNVETIVLPGDYQEPDESERTPVLDYTTKDNGVKLLWTGVSSSNFKYYKVVLSKYNSTPEYPDDGYLTYISNASETSYFVQELQSYNGGDFGGKVQDETYYMTVTAVYKDGKYTSNTKVVTVPSK